MKALLKVIAISLFFIISIPALSQSQKLQYNNERMEAMIKRDSAKLDAILADDLIYIHSNGLVENKSQHIHNIMSGKIIYINMEVKENSRKDYGKTEIINGLVEVSGKYDGKDFKVKLRFTEVNRKRKNKWQLVNWQSTKVD